MKQFRNFLYLLSVAFLLASCETEVDLFSDGEDKSVVFALLDQSAPVQYFRINPTFVGEGDARELAGNPDLTNYGDSVLTVRLYDLDSGTTDNPVYYTAEETTEQLDDNGIFDPNIKMYKINTPVSIASNGNVSNSILRPNHTYRLWIRNNVVNEIYTSEILMGDINDMRMLTPVDGDRNRITSHLKFYSGEQYQRFTFNFSRIDGADRYKLEMRYYYSVGQDSIPDSSSQYIDYLVGEVNNIDENASSVSIDFDGERFYQVIGTSLSDSEDRTGRRVDLIVTVAGDDLDTYIEVQNASISGLSQERPSYTNIEGGLGVFSYRSTKVYPGFYINKPTAEWLVANTGEPYRTGFKIRCANYGSTAGERIDCR